jgi:hypothetical protein
VTSADVIESAGALIDIAETVTQVETGEIALDPGLPIADEDSEAIPCLSAPRPG